MATKTIPQDFRDFLKLLEDEDVAYLLIGGYAVGYYGYPRATADMDVWIAVNPQNAQRTVAALKRFGMRMAEIQVNLISLEDLKINKKASGRHKDLDDLEHLP
jgi:predicted nucleotidyltransferase